MGQSGGDATADDRSRLDVLRGSCDAGQWHRGAVPDDSRGHNTAASSLYGNGTDLSMGIALRDHVHDLYIQRWGDLLSTVTFDTVNVTTLPAPPVCPSGWSCGDIGAPALAGSQSLNGGTWTINASGSDIWGTADQFRLVSQSLAANGSVSTRVVSQSNSSSWAKAGVMLRQTTDPGSMYYAVFVTPGNGIVMQYRKAQGGTTQQLVLSTGTVPVYLAVARTGTTYTAYTSSDGNTWTPVAGSSITLNMSGSVLAGLAVTSHNAKVLGTVVFDTVNIGTTIP